MAASNQKQEIPLSTINKMPFGVVHLHGEFERISSRRAYTNKRLIITEAIFSDETGTVKVVWFNNPEARKIEVHVPYELRGRLEFKDNDIHLVNSRFRPLTLGCKPFEGRIEEKARAPRPKKLVELPPDKERFATNLGVDPSSSWGMLRAKVLERDRQKCTACGSNSRLSVDHKVALRLGGSNALSNLTTLCKPCHELKHQRPFLDREFESSPDYGVNYKPSKKVTAIIRCIKAAESLDIRYNDRNYKRTERTIYPKRLFIDKDKIYVEAWCDLRGSDRIFRIARLELD